MITQVRGKWAKVAAVVLCVLLAWYCLGGSGFAVAAENASANDFPAESVNDAAAAADLTEAADEPAAAGEFEFVADEAMPEGDVQLLEAADSDAAMEGAVEDGAAISTEEPLMRAAASPVLRAAQDDVITSIEAWLSNNSEPMVNVGQWQVIRLNATFDLTGHDVHAGDTTTITLPNELKFDQTVGFQLLDTSGNVVANAEFNGDAKTLTLTYTEYAETHSGTNGSFFFYARIDRTVVTEEMDIPLNFDINGKTFYGGSIHFVGYPTPVGSKLSKSGTMLSGTDDPRHLRYQLNVNTSHEAIHDAVITDLISSPGITIDQDSIQIIHCYWGTTLGDWAIQNAQDVTSQYTVQWNADGNGFTLPLGDLGVDDGFQIRYNATANYDFVDGEIIDNTARLTGSDTATVERPATVTYYIAGGSAEGYVYSIQVLKTEEGNSDITLSGATFDVIRVANDAVVGTITTGADGTGSIGGLLHDTYKLVETEAPAGYELSDDPIFVYPDDFDDNKVAYVTVENAPVPETTSFTVDKTWIGPIADGPVTVNLTAGGQVVATGQLSADNGWHYEFDELAKYDENGDEIRYEVEELDLPGWSASYSYDGNAVTITNTSTETVDIPVSKAWVGPAAGPVTVALTADGSPVDAAQLTEGNGWQHTFEGLPVYDASDGHPIEYDVQEAPVAGYDSARSGSAATGFTFTNTNVTTTDISGSKTWADEDDRDGARPESITVRLLADGTEVATRTVTADDGWSWSFEGMPVYGQEDGHEILYTLTEDAVEGYSTSYAGFDVTNSHEPGKTSVTVTKAWSDENDKDGSRPQSVTVRLLADGADTGKALVLSSENSWTGSFEGLEEYDAGSRVAYTVAEDEVEGYTAAITGDAGKGYVIENSHTPTEPPTPTTPPRDRPKSTAPKTGDGLLAGTLALAGIASAALVVMVAARRGRGRDV